ncbi:MAG: DUF1565 domain-containing protein [Polyangiaceae bacterium]|nr:DUF1565 domain-containing protein [Polyangiaceae bacterium]
MTTLIAAACTGQEASPPANTDNSPVVPTNDTGIFVSSNTGSDANDGTQGSPVRTIGKALSLLDGKPNIFVCAGNYAEQVSLDGSTGIEGIGIYGGFDCIAWKYSASNKPVVRSPSSNYALKIANINSSVTISDIEFDAPTATNPGDSSISVFVVNSNNVQFVRTALVASSGQTGASGQTGSSNYEGTLAPSGNPAQGTVGGAQIVCACANNDNSTGGAGGSLAPFIPAGSGTPEDLGGGKGSVVTNACATGDPGNPGPPGIDGEVTKTPPPDGTVTSTFGSLDESGWHPTTSEAGTTGRTGQGGGGGGTYNGGGSGGCGGCGGAGGSSARGGGASVALLSLQSTITLTNASLTAGQAGSGGPGAPGQPGQGGGLGGAGGYNSTCTGGAGGNGGNGGASAGGAGGIAAGVLWSGLAPALDDATIANTTPGQAGLGGIGGNPGSNNGPDGVVGATLQVTP